MAIRPMKELVAEAKDPDRIPFDPGSARIGTGRPYSRGVSCPPGNAGIPDRPGQPLSQTCIGDRQDYYAVLRQRLAFGPVGKGAARDGGREHRQNRGWIFRLARLGRTHRQRPLVHLEVQRIMPILEITKQIGQVGMVHGLSRIICDQVLL